MSCGLQYKSPSYTITDKQTTELKDGFDCKIELNEISFIASGNSKRQAERAVAQEVLTHLKSNNA